VSLCLSVRGAVISSFWACLLLLNHNIVVVIYKLTVKPTMPPILACLACRLSELDGFTESEQKNYFEGASFTYLLAWVIHCALLVILITSCHSWFCLTCVVKSKCSFFGTRIMFEALMRLKISPIHHYLECSINMAIWFNNRVNNWQIGSKVFACLSVWSGKKLSLLILDNYSFQKNIMSGMFWVLFWNYSHSLRV
jgi:phosphatidylserine synthase